MLVEDCRNAVLRGVGSAQFLSLFNCVGKARAYTRPKDRQFQFSEYRTDLNECLAHGIELSVPAINSNRTQDNQPHMLFLDDVDDLTKLLRGTAQSRYLAAYEGASFLCRFQEQIKMWLYFCSSFLLLFAAGPLQGSADRGSGVRRG